MNQGQRSAAWLLVGVVSACATYSGPDESNESSGGTRATGGKPSAGSAGLAQAGQATKPLGGSGGASAIDGEAGESTETGGATPNGGRAAGGMPSAGTPAVAGSSAVAGSGGAGNGCGAPAVAPGTTPLIDDFNHLGRAVLGNEGRSGVWDVWTVSASADMFPKSANYQTTGADTGDGYTHWTGTGIGGPNDWGPTLTVQLAGGCPYDASVYSGISLRLKGTSSKTGTAGEQPLPLKVMIWQPQGVPPADAKGGACAAAACYNHYSTFVTVPAAWDTPVKVPFASLTQGSWTGTVPFVWNPKQLLAIQFQLEVNGSMSELATFDLSIDDLAFLP